MIPAVVSPPKQDFVEVVRDPSKKVHVFVNENAIDKIFAQKISGVIDKVKKISSKELIHAIQISFASNAEPKKPDVEVECPFNEDESIYRKEWIRGLNLQRQARHYQVPNLDKIKELHKLLKIYSNEINIDHLQQDIVRILNRRPVDHRLIAQARLAEVKENKVEMNLEDALKTIFLTTNKQKLSFLKMRNPFLVEEDLEALNKCLQKYLEWNISDRTLGQIKNKILTILEMVEKDDSLLWMENPTVREAWQEVGELLESI